MLQQMLVSLILYESPWYNGTRCEMQIPQPGSIPSEF